MLFALDAQVHGAQRSVHAESDGLGITVQTSRGPVRARHVNDAIRIARDDLGEFLMPAQRPSDVPWGLCVRVASVSAFYGDTRFCRVGGGGGGLPHNELVVRIRKRWHDRQGPIPALENAGEIIRAYLGREHRAAA